MNRRESLRKLMSGMVVSLVVAVWALGGFGQDRPAAPAQGPGGAKRTVKYYGYSTCAKNCHALKEPEKEGEYVCRCTEVNDWLNDKHKSALQALQGNRARQMEKLLRITAVEEKSCVRCHGVADPDKSHYDDSFKSPLEEGVTCMVCHGPYEEWVEKHRPIGGSVQKNGGR